jgi:hypothetical protein
LAQTNGLGLLFHSLRRDGSWLAIVARRAEIGMRSYGDDVIMLVAYAGLLAICGAYLAFGWRLPGTFGRSLADGSNVAGRWGGA